jgi:hypothetical protein
VDCPGKTEPSEISADMPLVVSIFPPYWRVRLNIDDDASFKIEVSFYIVLAML